MDNLSLSDIASVTGNKDGFLEGNGIIILILFFLIFGFGGGAWGNNQQGTQGSRFNVDLIHRLLLAS